MTKIKGFVKVMARLPVMGITLFPFILVARPAYKADVVLLNHERIHLRQQLELLVLPFYILYLLNYAVNLLVYKSHYQAYLNICFEREAYAHEADLAYNNGGHWFGWYKYIAKKS